MEPNRNVNRLKYLINVHSIMNQEKKKSFPWINERKTAQLESQNVTILGLPTNFVLFFVG